MDRTFRILVAVLVVALGISGIIAGISVYSDLQYKNTFKSGYKYECSIKADSILEHVKIFLPLPSGPTGNSDIGLEAGKTNIQGLPEGWKTGILGNDNWLMLELEADIIDPAEIGEEIIFYVTSESKEKIDTQNPVKFSEMLRPVNNPLRIACAEEIGTDAQCYMYNGQIFAYYMTDDDAVVQITLALTGENSWTIINRDSNIFYDTQSLTIRGDGKGWYDTEGAINAAIGSYS